jgi:poly(A) polymerase
MPMNPPRVELEFAVRYCLKEGGLNVRAPRVREKRPRTTVTAEARIDETIGEPEENQERKPGTGTSRSARRRRARQAKAPASALN